MEKDMEKYIQEQFEQLMSIVQVGSRVESWPLVRSKMLRCMNNLIRHTRNEQLEDYDSTH